MISSPGFLQPKVTGIPYTLRWKNPEWMIFEYIPRSLTVKAPEKMVDFLKTFIRLPLFWVSLTFLGAFNCQTSGEYSSHQSRFFQWIAGNPTNKSYPTDLPISASSNFWQFFPPSQKSMMTMNGALNLYVSNSSYNSNLRAWGVLLGFGPVRIVDGSFLIL